MRVLQIRVLHARLRLLALACFVIIVATALPRVARAGGDDTDIDAPEREALARINAYRESLQLTPLVDVPLLNAVAYEHSLDMARRHYFAHIDPDGRTPFDRLARVGYDADNEGENLAAGYADAGRTFEQWRHSPPHDAALRDPTYRAVGIGRVYAPRTRSHFYWTLLFGDEIRPQDFEVTRAEPQASAQRRCRPSGHINVCDEASRAGSRVWKASGTVRAFQ